MITLKKYVILGMATILWNGVSTMRGPDWSQDCFQENLTLRNVNNDDDDDDDDDGRTTFMRLLIETMSQEHG